MIAANSNNRHSSYLTIFILLLIAGFIVVRLAYPVRHLETGYVVHGYPWYERGLCERRECAVDRSRTVMEIFAAGLLGFGILKTRR
jgi:hypothetical protein